MVDGRWPIGTNAIYLCDAGYGASGVTPTCSSSKAPSWLNPFPPQCRGNKIVIIIHSIDKHHFFHPLCNFTI